MYHCHVSFYLAGRPCRAFEIAKEMQPLEYFTHEFVWSGEFEEALAGQANVVFANLEGLPGEDSVWRRIRKGGAYSAGRFRADPFFERYSAQGSGPVAGSHVRGGDSFPFSEMAAEVQNG